MEVDVDVDSTVDQDSEIDLDIADHQKKLEKEKKLKELETKIASDVHGLVTSWGLFGRHDLDNIDLILAWYNHNKDSRISKLLWAYENQRVAGADGHASPLIRTLRATIGEEGIDQYPNIKAFIELIKRERIPQACFSKQFLSNRRQRYMFGKCGDPT